MRLLKYIHRCYQWFLELGRRRTESRVPQEVLKPPNMIKKGRSVKYPCKKCGNVQLAIIGSICHQRRLCSRCLTGSVGYIMLEPKL